MDSMQPYYTVKPKLPKAVAFVDYEHWLIALQKLHHIKPNIGSWIEDLSMRVQLRDLYFFGDFSTPEMEGELCRIRSFTNKIIETKNAGNYRKDFTDFIMLDAIYQQIILSPDVEAYIFFTGDAHFNSVAAFIKTICRKTVGVYGIQGSLSNQLKNTADWWYEVPFESEMYLLYYRMILNNIKYLEQRKERSVFPTFMRTVQCTADYNQVEADFIKDALQKLITEGYITQGEEYIGFRQTLKVLRVDWEAVVRDGIWIDAAPVCIK